MILGSRNDRTSELFAYFVRGVARNVMIVQNQAAASVEENDAGH